MRTLLKAPRKDGSWFRAELEQMKNTEAKTMKTLHSLVAGLWPASSILARWSRFRCFHSDGVDARAALHERSLSI